MSTVPRARRKTDPCPCGSGKQYRYCHGVAAAEADDLPDVQRSPGRVFLWLVAVGVPLAVFAASWQGAPEDTAKQRVWSEEHGHYHTIDGKELGAPATPAPVVVGSATGSPDAQPGTQPPGPVPPGKVWSPEHGHWHDVDGGDAEPVHMDPSNGMPWDHAYELKPPEGDAPDGMTWSAAHGHWHPIGQ